jgi:hypothetical protein
MAVASFRRQRLHQAIQIFLPVIERFNRHPLVAAMNAHFAEFAKDARGTKGRMPSLRRREPSVAPELMTGITATPGSAGALELLVLPKATPRLFRGTDAIG